MGLIEKKHYTKLMCAELKDLYNRADKLKATVLNLPTVTPSMEKEVMELAGKLQIITDALDHTKGLWA
jgi:hypothetical protein